MRFLTKTVKGACSPLLSVSQIFIFAFYSSSPQRLLVSSPHVSPNTSSSKIKLFSLAPISIGLICPVESVFRRLSVFVLYCSTTGFTYNFFIPAILSFLLNNNFLSIHDIYTLGRGCRNFHALKSIDTLLNSLYIHILDSCGNTC